MGSIKEMVAPDPQGAAEASLLAKGLSVPVEMIRENRKIMVVSQEPGFSEPVWQYAVNLAERLGYDLLLVNVGPAAEGGGWLAGLQYRWLQWRFRLRARRLVRQAAKQLAAKGLGLEHQVWFGDLRLAIERLNQARRRIEFVLNAAEASEAAMLGGVNLPVFTIKGVQEDKLMTAPRPGNWQVVVKTIGWGVATAALYAAVFVYSGPVMSYFTRGGLYAALPIATVFLFSYVHGTFAHYVWEMLGIRAPQVTTAPRPTAPRRTSRPRPRLRLNV